MYSQKVYRTHNNVKSQLYILNSRLFSLKVLAHFRSKQTGGFSPLTIHSKTRITKRNIFKQRPHSPNCLYFFQCCIICRPWNSIELWTAWCIVCRGFCLYFLRFYSYCSFKICFIIIVALSIIVLSSCYNFSSWQYLHDLIESSWNKYSVAIHNRIRVMDA